MRLPRGTIWTERALMVLFLATLAGALNLVMAVHRRVAAARNEGETVSNLPVQLNTTTTSVPTMATRPPRASTPTIVPAPSPPKPPSPTPEDPTKKALAELEAAAAQEIEAARQADRRTESLEKARLNAVAESERWRRREMLVNQQVSALADRTRKIDKQIDTLAAQRDALAQERDALKATVTSSAQGKGSYAVLPYKGPNGTWQRPIVLECSNGMVTLRPKGPTFSMLDLSSMINPRSSPVILAIARELLRVQMSDSPDGAPVVPYFVFLIRPDGIRPYYEARARLEPLGVAFGYELIEQDLKVDVPDFDNLATWDGTIPLEEPLMPAPAAGNNEEGDGLAWPSPGTESRGSRGSAGNGLAGRPSNQAGAADPGTEGQSPGEFVWPSQHGAGASMRAGASSNAGTGAGGGPGLLARGGGGSSPGLVRGDGGSSGLAQGGGGSLGLVPGAGGSSGLAQGPRPGSFSGGPRSGEGQGGPGSESGSDPALKPWPWPNQGLEQGASGSGEGENLADGKTEAGSPPDSFGSGTGPRGARRDQGVALLPELEPAGNGSSSLDPGDLAGGLSAAAAGALGQNGLPILNGPGNSGAGSRSAQPAAAGTVTAGTATAGTGTDLAGTGGANAPRPPATGNVPPPGSPTNPRLPNLRPDMNSGTNTNASRVAQNGKAGSANRSRPAGDSRAGAGLDSTFGSQGPTSSSSSANASAGAAGSTRASLNGSAGAVGSSLASMAGIPSLANNAAAGLVFGADPGSPSHPSKDPSDGPMFQSRIQDRPSKAIEVPFEIVVVCGPNGAVIHPGGYQLTRKSLETSKKDSIVVRELLAVQRRRAESDPTIRPQPRVKFLVENGGTETFWAARKQILFSGLGWPMSLQVAGAQDPHMLGKETW